MYAPVVLFVYNRPWHTEQTLEALMLNDLADKSELYIYCDGAKIEASEDDLKKIKEVKKLIRKKKWCKKNTIIESEDNLGLANSVINGVSKIIKKHGKVIVLEDDIVTGKYFLNFMNEGLNLYKNDDKVYGISGYSFPYQKKIKEETFFLPIMSSWGYGIWLESWEKINFDGVDLLNKVIEKKIERKLDFGGYQFYQMLKDQVEKRNDSWAIRFYVSMFLNEGYFLYPNFTLIKNIGFDGTGVHCSLDNTKIHKGSYNNYKKIEIKKKKVRLKKEILNKFKPQNKNVKNSLLIKIKKLGKTFIAPEILKLIKRKAGLNKKKVKSELENLPRYTQTKTIVEGKEIIVPDNASFLFMYKEIFKENIYKFETTNKKPYIIDGGANIGLASIYLKLLYPDAEIIAFEPDNGIFDILENNIKSFNYDNIKLIKKGLWDENKTLSFHSEGADGGTISDLDTNIKSTESIEVVSLKPYLNKRVDFLKLDIEGAETLVLNNIADSLDVVDRIFVEYHSFVNQKQTLNEIIDILTNANFRLYMSIPGNNSLSSPLMGLNNYNNMDFQLNIFGFKENL